MAEYPYYPRQTSLRLGAIGLALLLLATIAAFAIRARRSAVFEAPLPRHPSATAVVTRQSKLLRWRMTSYQATATPEAIQQYYRQEMPGDGWQAKGRTALPNGSVSRWLRRELTLEVQAVETGEQTAVTLLVTPNGPVSER